jgi:hypothetical protein
MRQAATLLLLTGLALLLGQEAHAQAGAPAKLEGMEYLRAREIILGYGWRPRAGECRNSGEAERNCARYPEISVCSGTGLGYCAMTFVKTGRCLVVTTIGGVPQEKPGDTHVDHLRFFTGSCPTPGRADW